MIIKNLAQLKRTLVPGVKFEILLHNRPENIGQVRRITKAGSTSFYSVVDGEPEHKISKGNNGLGAWCSFDAAKFWTFDAEGVCAKYSDFKYQNNEIILAFKIIDPCKTCANAGWETMDKVAACNCCEAYEFYTPEKRKNG